MQKHYRQCLDKLAGDAPERKAANELPQFSQGSMARPKEETNRCQQLGETG